MAGAAPHGDLGVLLAQAAAGDERAWETLTARFSRLVWAVARSHRMSPEDCADAVQNTWLRLLENVERIQRPEALPGWLTTTARHEALGVLRRRGREVLSRRDDVATEVADAVADDLDAVLLEDERDAPLWRCFRSLSARCQQLLRVLMGADRAAYTEVAVELGMPIGSIGPTPDAVPGPAARADDPVRLPVPVPALRWSPPMPPRPWPPGEAPTEREEARH